MTKKSILQYIFIGLMFICLSASAAFAQTTAFTYQGKLTNNGTPATGTYEMRFTLFDLPAGGFEFGTPKIISNIVATNGVFTVVIPIGDWSFDQSERYMEIAVRPQGNVNPFTVLAPLQQITNSPKAIFANTAAFAGFSAASGNALNLAGLGIEQFVLKNVNGEIVAPRFENLAADPAPASAANTGRVYFNTTKKNLMVSNGTEWVNISTPRVQTFTGNSGTSDTGCVQFERSPIRTVTFTKSSAASRLRITYRDTAQVENNFPGDPQPFIIEMAVDIPSNAGWYLEFAAQHGLSKTALTTVGYADGVTVGTHTFTSVYIRDGPSFGCYRTGSYFIEIEEVP